MLSELLKITYCKTIGMKFYCHPNLHQYKLSLISSFLTPLHYAAYIAIRYVDKTSSKKMRMPSPSSPRTCKNFFPSLSYRLVNCTVSRGRLPTYRTWHWSYSEIKERIISLRIVNIKNENYYWCFDRQCFYANIEIQG